MVDLPGLLPDLGKVFFDHRVLFQILTNEHQRKTDQQQPAGDPDGSAAEPDAALAANAGAQSKQQNDAKIAQHPVFGLGVAGAAPDTQGLHAAAQVADAHGAGKGVAVHLAERLHLHGAGKGDDGVGQQVLLLRQKAHKEQQQHLAQHHQLPPVEPLHVPEVLLHLFGGQHAQRKGAQGHQIMQHPLPVSVHQVGTEQHDVAGLRVGKYLAAEQVGVGVLQAAGQGQEYGCKKRFGHLSAMF